MFIFMLHTAVTGLKGLTLFSICSSYARKDNTLTLNSDKPIPPKQSRYRSGVAQRVPGS